MATRRNPSPSGREATSVQHDQVIYLDHNATTPLDEAVFAQMRPFFVEHFGNSASRTHTFGQIAQSAVEGARESVAKLIGCDSRGIIWTSGATESNNLAIKGVTHALRGQGRHVVTQATEHPAVLDPCVFLREQGFDVTVLPVDQDGIVSPESLARAIRSDTVLVSIMYANNETGVVQPIAELAKLCRKNGILFHTDATQAIGKLEVNVKDLGVDLLSLSAHKLYGPKGVGALFVRPGLPKVRLAPQLHGGGHERGLRSGTLNVPGIVGFGAAAAASIQTALRHSSRIGKLREQLETGLLTLGGVEIHGSRAPRLPNTTSAAFHGLDAEAALVAMPSLALSTGSACTSLSVEPSHVLQAMGVSDANIRGTIRFSLGRSTTAAEIEHTLLELEQTVSRLRALRFA